ncbi:MAG: GYD domain-containing protein [Candidatus Palauibacterales bacterium]|nr:GYD domain-containing protein [Candidatus Palauibacterales bacterium]MDP2483199.1 GYD domain-containing protein [Candidatus Palauibacterales bacterium]
MAKYMVAGSYTPDGIPGLLEEGGTGRVKRVTRMIEALGGTVESFYYGFGDHDVYVIVDLPDHESATAISMAVNATGAVVLTTTVLLTPEQMDAAARKAVDYQAPGD